MKIIAQKLMKEWEVECVMVKLVADNGDEFTLWQQDVDKEVRLDCNGTLLIESRASNRVTLRRLESITEK
jgi:hypothetical protein